MTAAPDPDCRPEERLGAVLDDVIAPAFRAGLRVARIIDAHPQLEPDLAVVIDELDTLIRHVRRFALAPASPGDNCGSSPGRTLTPSEPGGPGNE